MPSEQDHDAAERALAVSRSWRTRMASVLRQFETLTSKPVYDKSLDQMVNVVGICQSLAGPMIQVIPTDADHGLYSVTVEDLVL